MKSKQKAIQWNIIGIIGFVTIIIIGIVVSINGRTISYATIDNIPCNATEGTVYHAHTLLSIYINDKEVKIPSDIGIASDSSCLYWLHTHDSTGIIHIEAPQKIAPTLGNFLDIWKSSSANLRYTDLLNEQGATTKLIVYVNGNLYLKDFRSIVLHSRTMITLLYNSSAIKPVTLFNWNGL